MLVLCIYTAGRKWLVVVGVNKLVSIIEKKKNEKVS